MEMWNGKCGILELGLSECAAKMHQSKAAPTAQKDIQQGKAGAFFLTWKCRLPSCHLSFIMHFNQVTGWRICSQSKSGIYNLIQNYLINRNNLILLYKFMSTMRFGFNVKCVFRAPGWEAHKWKPREWFNFYFPGRAGCVSHVDCCSQASQLTKRFLSHSPQQNHIRWNSSRVMLYQLQVVLYDI